MVYRVSYAEVNNAGDQLNVYIMRNIFGIEIVCSNPLRAQISGIGSHLSSFQQADDAKTRFLQCVLPKKEVHIWGTGFLRQPKQNEKSFYNPYIVFDAVRGNLSKERVEKLIGKHLEIPVCDGGILTSLMFHKPIPKRYELGIIPHYKEQDSPWFERLKQISDKSTIINLRADPMEVYRTIGECEYVLSSSLHGLIISDSFGIPNLHIRVTDQMLGDGFKFHDYYSGYGKKDQPYVLTAGQKMPTIHDIIDRYDITAQMVQQKQKQMIDCFPVQKKR